jgi:DNA-binding NarL/FixJ family response regulator
MRVVIVGRANDRDRFVQELADTPLEVIGEVETLAEARRFEADAILLAGGRTGNAAGGGQDAAAEAEPLTARERDVLALLAEGLPNKAIAARLGISDQTVKFHVAAICGKLGAANRTEAVRVAIRRGIVAI